MNEARRQTRRGGRQHNRTDYRGMVAKGTTSTPVNLGGEDGRGLRIVGTVCPTALAKVTMCRYTIRPVLDELKANAERLHIETGSPILTDEQLMFEAASGSNNGRVYGFGSVCSRYRGVPGRQKQLVIGSFGIFYDSPRGLYREGEEVVGIHAAGTGEVHLLHDIIHISV
ncbi:hypothetical protein M9H77_06997 [Catharanthus roseus]|uniref:Uncharacterized protein n=1 Tax=Catharanthus roseus TaxID=4058 RepID=A0ACC0BTY6_CATRO|nr:hypothetical protein M9H77_06997 [Catharanthus roseus]